MRPQLTYANVVATLALFLALGTGGAFAASKVIDGRTIKAGSVKTRQLGSSAVTSAKVKNGSLTSSDFRKGTLKAGPAGPAGVAGSAGPAGAPGAAAALSPSSVGAAELKADAVSGAKVADGSLSARDVGRFAGSTEIAFGTVGPNACVTGTTSTQTPVAAGQDLSDDAIVVTPEATFPTAVVLYARPAGTNTFTVVACNTSGNLIALGVRTLRYVTFDVPAS